MKEHLFSLSTSPSTLLLPVFLHLMYKRMWNYVIHNNFACTGYQIISSSIYNISVVWVTATMITCSYEGCSQRLNPLTPNDHYSGRTATLTSKSCLLYIYSSNIGTEYFKHGIYSSFFPSKCSLFHNSNVFGSCVIHNLYTGCAKI